MIDQLAACFTDRRRPELIEHSLTELLRQRIFGMAMGYEDLNDHDTLRRDPVMALGVGKPDPLGMGAPAGGRGDLASQVHAQPAGADQLRP
ncbi:MAG: transposase [Verrucomicrobiales bacterium]